MTADASQVDAIHYPHCGYNLFGIDSQRCPECGAAIDRTLVGQSNLPWTHRRSIGRWRAFWRTVLLVIFRPTRLAQEMNRPVRYADAILFRRICVVVAWVAIFGFALFVFFTDSGSLLDQWETGAGMVGFAVGAWVWLLAITGLPSLFFHPRAMPTLRQNRAVALSFYSSGPLVFLLLAAIAFAVAILLKRGTQHHFNLTGWEYPFCWIGFIVAPTALVMSPASAMMLLGRTTRCGGVRKWGMFATHLIAMLLFIYPLVVGITCVAVCLEILARQLFR